MRRIRCRFQRGFAPLVIDPSRSHFGRSDGRFWESIFSAKIASRKAGFLRRKIAPVGRSSGARISLASMVILTGCYELSEEIHIAASDVVVVDGDTVRFDDQTYRLLGFDTPEVYFPNCSQELEMGKAASAHLTALLRSGDTVRLTLAPRRDRYDRFLAQMWIDGRSVSDEMISSGLARSYDGGRRESWCNG